jgi:hypothetical protein
MKDRNRSFPKISLISTLCLCCGLAVSGSVLSASKWDKADFNKDKLVDEKDLALFSTKRLDRDPSSVDWCVFHADTMQGEPVFGESSKPYLNHYSSLLDFIFLYFECGVKPEPEPSPLELKNSPGFLTRIASSAYLPDQHFVSDPKLGSVFIYDSAWTINAELKNLDKPLGIAIDTLGNILVGNDGRGNIEVYNPQDGSLVTSFGEDLVQMPNAISIGPDGTIYITDSKADNLKVFDAGYNFVTAIGATGSLAGEFKFPVDTEIIGDEIFVADQVNMRIQIFDLEGNYLRSIDKGPCGGISCEPPVFQRLQALTSDAEGNLHALDVFEARVTIFDSASGAILGSYGGYGDTEGQLKLPIDILILETGEAAITDAGKNQIEVLSVP